MRLKNVFSRLVAMLLRMTHVDIHFHILLLCSHSTVTQLLPLAFKAFSTSTSVFELRDQNADLCYEVCRYDGRCNFHHSG